MVELFPCLEETKGSIFERAQKVNATKQEKGKRVKSQGHRGSLWNRARHWRRFFIDAGICKTSIDEDQQDKDEPVNVASTG